MKQPVFYPFNSLRANPLKAFCGIALPLAIALVGFALITPVPAQEIRLRTLSVTGQGEEMIPTTLTQVSLGVEVQGNTAAQAQQEAARRTSSVVDLLRSHDVENLATTGINLSPRYDYNSNTQRLVGYTASNIVTFKVATDEAGSIMDDAVNAGATRIDGVSFTAEDDAIATAQRVALQEATTDAQAQADAVLEALGLSAQDIVAIQVNHASPPPMPFFDQRSLASSVEAASTPVVGGEQQVTASVTLHISY